MPRNVPIWSIMVFALVGTPLLAGPGDLLKQAIEENDGVDDATAEQVKKLVCQADKLLEQRSFGEAIELYEQAYRLAPMDQSNYVRLLVAKRAAGRMTTQEQEALELIRAQESANIDQAFRLARIDILQARRALRMGDGELAMVKLEHAKAMLDGLPKHVDDAPYRRLLTELRTTAVRKAKQTANRADRTGTASVDRPVGEMPANPPGPTGDVLTLMDGADGADPLPTGEIVDLDALLAGSDDDTHDYDRELARARRLNRVEWLLSNNEAAMAPLADMTFPADWPERSSRRARYRDGVIYESQPFTGKDGKTYTTAIYDLGDLVHPVPNFYATYPGTARMQRMQMLDRDYLRERSQIFNGYADDLAAGLPLLHFFGGIDNNAVSTRTDPRETDRIVRIIERFVNGG
ncbi:MAG: hypothetical protein JXQ75_22755 [Phycisphaerae bacterium]|nr:hypothetical protein [Phycisphaerae bacterium]